MNVRLADALGSLSRYRADDQNRGQPKRSLNPSPKMGPLQIAELHRATVLTSRATKGFTAGRQIGGSAPGRCSRPQQLTCDEDAAARGDDAVGAKSAFERGRSGL